MTIKALHIEWTYDCHSCEVCGSSDAYGYRATLDGELLSEFEPIAHCYDGKSIDSAEAYRAIFKALGYAITESEGE